MPEKKDENKVSEAKDDKKVEIKEKEEKPEKTDEKIETAPGPAGGEGEAIEASKPITFADLDHYSEIRKDLPLVKPGDVVRVFYRVIEGGKERTQVFEGTIIAIKNSGISRTITVRKTSFGIAVERIFPLNSKLLQKIEIKKHSRVRRSKLYFLRKLRGKAARLKDLR